MGAYFVLMFYDFIVLLSTNTENTPIKSETLNNF